MEQGILVKGSFFFTRPRLVHYTRTRAELVTRATEVFNQIRAGSCAYV